MITADKKIEQTSFANLSDYSQECPKGKRSFYVFVNFHDNSTCMKDNIFAVNRAEAFAIALQVFADCTAYIHSISIQAEDGEN